MPAGTSVRHPTDHSFFGGSMTNALELDRDPDVKRMKNDERR